MRSLLLAGGALVLLTAGALGILAAHRYATVAVSLTQLCRHRRTSRSGQGLGEREGNGCSELAIEITRAICNQRGLRPGDRAAHKQRQEAMLGARKDQLLADAASALADVHPDMVKFMRQAGALSNANVIVVLAHTAQARAARV